MSDIFISYRREDASGSAGRLADHLEKYFTKKAIFRDVVIEDGKDWWDAIEKQLKSCSVFLAVIGPRWLDAFDAKGQRRLDDPEDWVRREISAALQRIDIRVIPVLVDNAPLPEEQNLPNDLKPLLKRNARRITDASWDDEIKRLARSISKVMGWQRRLRLKWFLNPYGVMLFSLLPLILVAASIFFIPNIQKAFLTAAAKHPAMEFPDTLRSIDGQTLFVSPYKLYPSTSKNYEDQLNGIFGIILGLNVQTFLSSLTGHAPDIGIRIMSESISSTDYEKAKKAGVELNALGIVTGVGEIKKISDEPVVKLRSSFFIIPQNKYFFRYRNEIVDDVPINELSPFYINIKKSWGQNAVIAYILKALEGTMAAQKNKFEKLKALRSLLVSMRSKMASDDPLLKDVDSLYSHINSLLLAAKPGGVKS